MHMTKMNRLYILLGRKTLSLDFDTSSVEYWWSYQVSKSNLNNVRKSDHLESTGWTNVNLLYLSDSIEITSLEGLTL